MEYRVLSGATAKSLEEQVIDLAQEGFVPQGGVSVSECGSQYVESALVGNGPIKQVALLFSQAMVKLSEPKIVQTVNGKTVDKPDRDQWVRMRLKKDYAQYWDEKQQLYVIIEPGKDQGDGTATGDEIWKTTRDELIADLEKSYDYEHGE